MDITDETQLKRAILEDELLELVLKHYDRLVMHGGTAIWRCYGGNRFSRDLDFYNNLDPSKESEFQKNIHKILIDNGYSIREEKYNNKTLTLHIIIRGNATTGKLDITFKKASGIAAEYVKVDGSKKLIYSLSPEELLREKIDTYINKYENGTDEIQDLYDIMILKDKVTPTQKISERLKKLVLKVKERAPEDEKELHKLIISGVTPDFTGIINIIERWLDEIGRRNS